MVLWNCKNPDISLALIPWYVPMRQTVAEIGWELHERLKNNPDDTFCGIALENGFIQGILIMFCRKNDVFVWQTRAKRNFKYSKLIWWLVQEWTKAKDRDKITAGAIDKGNIRRLHRYGFKDSENGEVVKIIK